MKSYLSLIPISAKIHRKQNRMTLLCIAISVFLVTAVFSMAEMGLRMEADRLSEKHTDFSLRMLLGSTMGQMFAVVAATLFVLILIAGVLMISGSINSNVAQKVRFFGMMRCIGMSGHQIKRFVRLEALNWCKTAIPVGLVSGTVFTWAACALLRFVVGEEFSDISIFIISIPGIIGGTTVGIITVLIASNAPAKRAAKVSPASAISGTSDMQRGNTSIIKNGMIRVETKLGLHHALNMKKNMFLMSGSFALSIILFFSFLVFIDLVNYAMPQSHSSADIAITGNQENLLDEKDISVLDELDGITRVYGRRSSLDISAEVNGTSENIDIISFDDFEINCLSKDHMLKRGSNPDKIYGDSEYVLATWDKDSTVSIGDTIRIGNKELKIAGLLKYDPFSADGLTDGKITLITSGETFKQLTGVNGYNLINIQISDSITDEQVEYIKGFIGENGKVEDRRDMSTFGTYMAFMIFVYGFLAIIALVALLNIINSISMSVSARIKQYGVMRAVGMSSKQVTKMIVAEASTYAIIGSVFGCVIGLTINRTLYKYLIENHFAYALWNIPVIPLLVVAAFILCAVVLAVVSPAERIHQMAITETINEL